MIAKNKIKEIIENVKGGANLEGEVPKEWLKNTDKFEEEFTHLMHDYFFEMGDTKFNRTGLRSASDEVYNYVMGIEKPKEISVSDYDIEHFDFWC